MTVVAIRSLNSLDELSRKIDVEITLKKYECSDLKKKIIQKESRDRQKKRGGSRIKKREGSKFHQILK